MTKKGYTYKGAVKPFGKTGHFNEPRRHSLQAKGFKTGHQADAVPMPAKKILMRKGSQPFSFDEHNWSMERDEKGNYKLTLGNFSDAGWFWDGKKDELAGFFVRLNSSKVEEEFLKKMVEGNVSFASLKDDLVKSAETGDGIYQLTGDNVKWHFGEDDEQLSEVEAQVAEEERVDEGLLSEATDEGEYKGTDFNVFKKSTYYKEAKENLVKAVENSSNWEELFSKLDKVKDDAMQDSFEFSSVEASDLVMAGLRKLKGGK